uniref:Ribosomal protein S3 n=1 Tax=Babesia motasi TaxID=237580 RepID=A0A411ADG2_9APIC|nr:ribosomal protein S3 [Babesia motasi]QAX27120.1 ribosomal protein S3 [Babesia motasi]
MTKAISPVLFRHNIFSNYINKTHIKLNKNLSNLNYFKFFQLLLNILNLYKHKLRNYNAKKNFLYFTCTYSDTYNLCINLRCSKIRIKTDILHCYVLLYQLIAYINYFITYNLYLYNKIFVWSYMSYTKNLYTNKFYIIKTLKYYIARHSNYYTKIAQFCNTILNNKFNKSCRTLKSIKIIYAGCLNKGGSKKKIFNYIHGSVPITSKSVDIDYIKDYIKTYKGTIGIKCWLVF